MRIAIDDVISSIFIDRHKGNKMPVMIGAASGLMDGLGISLVSKGEIALGLAWFFTGLAVAWALYMRVREEQKVPVKSEVDHRDKRQ